MDIKNKVISIIKDSIPGDTEVTPKKSLQEMEIDSITFIKIVVELETTFDFEFVDEKLILSAFSTVQDMIDYVQKSIGGNEQ